VSICDKKIAKHRSFCVGSLNERITIYSRQLKSPTLSSVDFSEDFTLTYTVWASIETVNGSELFDGVNLSNAYDHKIVIRYKSDITKEYYIVFNSIRYEIIDVENLDEANEWLVIKCKKKGSTTLNATAV